MQAGSDAENRYGKRRYEITKNCQKAKVGFLTAFSFADENGAHGKASFEANVKDLLL